MDGPEIVGSNPTTLLSSAVIHELTWYVSSTGSTVVLRDIASNRISKWRSVKTKRTIKSGSDISIFFLILLIILTRFDL